MIPCTITYGNLKIDRDHAGNLLIARTDVAECLTLSRSEWSFILKVADIFGLPVAPPNAFPQLEST